MNDILSTDVYTIHTVHSHGFKNGTNPLLHDHNKVTFVGIFKTSYIQVFRPQCVLHMYWTEAAFSFLYRVAFGCETWKTYNYFRQNKTITCPHGNHY